MAAIPPASIESGIIATYAELYLLPRFTTNEYLYDDLGKQISWKKVIDSRQTLVYYTHGFDMDAKRVNNINYYMHSDVLGSITAITNSSGSVQSTYEYDPYGIMLRGNTDVLGNFGFTGQEIDLETGFYHFPARYYEPYWGRFLTRDPYTNLPEDTRNLSSQSFTERDDGYYKFTGEMRLQKLVFHTPSVLNPQMLNCYSYVINNPIVWHDPYGFAFVVPGNRMMWPNCAKWQQCNNEVADRAKGLVESCEDDRKDCFDFYDRCPPLGMQHSVPPLVGKIDCVMKYFSCLRSSGEMTMHGLEDCALRYGLRCLWEMGSGELLKRLLLEL